MTQPLLSEYMITSLDNQDNLLAYTNDKSEYKSQQNYFNKYVGSGDKNYNNHQNAINRELTFDKNFIYNESP